MAQGRLTEILTNDGVVLSVFMIFLGDFAGQH